MSDSMQVYITDKSGKKFFNTNCSVLYKDSEIRNLQRHIDQARKHPQHYKFLDLDTAKIVEESNLDLPNLSDDELLKMLGEE